MATEQRQREGPSWQWHMLEETDAKEQGQGRQRTKEAWPVGWTHQTAEIGSGVRTGPPGPKMAGGIGAGTGQPRLKGVAGVEARAWLQGHTG